MLWNMYTPKDRDVDELLKRTQEWARWRRINYVLLWDRDTQMPDGGVEMRSDELRFVSGKTHEAFLALNDGDLLLNLNERREELNADESIIVQELWKDYERENKIPTDLVERMNKASSEGTAAWKSARRDNDPDTFLPHLKEMVELKKEAISHYGYADSPYDALLDIFEPGATVREIDGVLKEVRDMTLSLLDRLDEGAKLGGHRISHTPVSISRQKAFNDTISADMGFDFTRGMTSISTHPFTNLLHPGDVRFTSRYREDNVFYSLTSTLHETGHALYEQGLSHEHTHTPLGWYLSLGIHESQSRFWENFIGRNPLFISNLYRKLSGALPEVTENISEEDIVLHLNGVERSLIRTGADELTYNLHIIIRYEIEQALFEDSVSIDDIEEVWNTKYREYLGIEPSSPAEGFLQDVHWSQGLMGYFPTYTLGNLYAAQFAHAMEEDLDLNGCIEKEDYGSILAWMGEKIHSQGRRFDAATLVKRVSGEELNAKYLSDRLEKKVSLILSA